jgi:CBS domain-containing protein
MTRDLLAIRRDPAYPERTLDMRADRRFTPVGSGKIEWLFVRKAPVLKEGERMLLVRNVMTEDVKTVSPEMDAFDVAGVMRSHDVGSAPVVDGDGRLVGIVTDRDLVIRVLGDRADPKGIRVGDVATRRSIFTISPDAQVSEARALMAAERIRRLPVVKGERLVGIVSLGDVAEADSSARAVGEALKEISASPATLERALRPDPGTPDRVRKHRS